MIVIPVSADGRPPIWTIIELQGEIEQREAAVDGVMQTVGTLCLSGSVSRTASGHSCTSTAVAKASSYYINSIFAQKSGIVELTVGYHQLEGKLVALTKPLAVLEKRAIGGMDQLGAKEAAVEYKVRPCCPNIEVESLQQSLILVISVTLIYTS